VAVLEPELEIAMAMSMPLVVPMEIETTGVYTRMTMWQECRGLTIRHPNQSPTSITITDESTATAIPEWIGSPRGILADGEGVSIADVTTISRRPNR